MNPEKTPLQLRRSKVRLNSFDNSWYNPGSAPKRVLWLCVNALFFNHGLAVLNGLKIGLLRAFGARVGKGVLIKPSVNIKYPWFLSIGDHCWIGENVWIDNLAPVHIGDHVCLSQGAMLLTGNHDFTSTAFDLILKPITLEEGVWIGARSTVCPGVHAEPHAVLSVQSVATSRLSAYTIYQGNPALPKKERQIRN
jgi:putative colanic acid biosynthesis acetyltransferase WcaF